jgi:hypothetical protein
MIRIGKKTNVKRSHIRKNMTPDFSHARCLVRDMYKRLETYCTASISNLSKFSVTLLEVLSIRQNYSSQQMKNSNFEYNQHFCLIIWFLVHKAWKFKRLKASNFFTYEHRNFTCKHIITIFYNQYGLFHHLWQN